MSSPAQTVTANITVTIRGSQTQTSGSIGLTAGGGSLALAPTIQVVQQLANAAGAALGVDQLYAAQISLVASTPQTFHFETATLKDPFGNTLAMLRIRGFCVQNVTASSGFDVKVESSAANGIPWLPPSSSPLIARANGGLIFIYDPNSEGGGVGNVVGSTTDGVTLDPGSNACTVNFWVIGDSVV